MARSAREIHFKYNFGVYWSLLKKYKLMFISLTLLVLLVEVTYLLDNYLFKIVIDKADLFSKSVLTRESFLAILLIIGIIYTIESLLRGLMKFLSMHILNRLDANLMRDLKCRFFNHITGLSYQFHTTHKTGSLISRLVRCGSAIERMTDILSFNFGPLFFKLIVTIIILFFISWEAALITFVTTVVFILFTYIFQRIQQPYSVLANDAEDYEKAIIGDMLSNIDSIKYFGKKTRVQTMFKNISMRTRSATIKHWDYYRYTDMGQTLILGMGTFFLVFVAVHKFLAGTMSMGSFVFIFTTFLSLVGPLYGFMHGVRSFYQVMADFEVLFQYEKIHNEVKNFPNAGQYKIKNGEIFFDQVSFKYGKRTIFNNLSLHIPRNKKYAFVGHSGCGKTTFIKLLYRLYDIESGKITIDGRNITSWKKESLRSEMSIVPQECALFDDTIYNNILFSKPTATRKEVARAIRFAQLDKIIKNFPQKEKTIVGERGVKLSGGEKQRVSIARAILANKQILVLDEATSALDSHTEHEIQTDLEKLMQGRTSIIIAHRLSTIMKADVIVVMAKGKIVQMGSHTELIKEVGQYKKLWNLQKGGYIK